MIRTAAESHTPYWSVDVMDALLWLKKEYPELVEEILGIDTCEGKE